jgi:hypothetical protein
MISDAGLIRDLGNLPDSVSAGQLKPHQRAAARRLKRWVGTAYYEAAETEAATLDTTDDGFIDWALASDMCSDLADAEACLAINSALPALNMSMQGTIAEGDAAGITVEGQIGENTYRYLTPAQVEGLQKQFLNLAEQAASDYLADTTGGVNPPPQLSHAYDDDGYAIDEDWPEVL